MSSMDELFARIKKNREEFDYQLRQLEMWKAVIEQGIDPEKVDRFAFDNNLISFAERKRLRWHPNSTNTNVCNPYNWPLKTNEDGTRVIVPRKYNVVILITGEIKKLDPVINAP